MNQNVVYLHGQPKPVSHFCVWEQAVTGSSRLFWGRER